ncbi:MAG: hypothetical protein SPL86_03910 [Succiniclasticum sp.]|uniref:hypothetical protein n=1 Tax=Succiniclasticum sp. TaxID=2775030 RepID=UPI002A90E98D|nr:hypothetical protein [Succiniclasticum sp.]MDY6290610.1 hypothetical protein [Succiniclasticum sp.]
MNKKAEQFHAFLEEQKITVFQMEELEGNELHTVVFRSYLGVEGQQLPTIVIIDDSIFSIIRVQIAPQALKEENTAELLKLVNGQNVMYKPFKLFFDNRGNLMLDVCLVTEGDKLEGNAVYQIFSVIINYLDENYREIMKTVWQ